MAISQLLFTCLVLAHMEFNISLHHPHSCTLAFINNASRIRLPPLFPLAFVHYAEKIVVYVANTSFMPSPTLSLCVYSVKFFLFIYVLYVFPHATVEKLLMHRV